MNLIFHPPWKILWYLLDGFTKDACRLLSSLFPYFIPKQSQLTFYYWYSLVICKILFIQLIVYWFEILKLSTDGFSLSFSCYLIWINIGDVVSYANESLNDLVNNFQWLIDLLLRLYLNWLEIFKIFLNILPVSIFTFFIFH